MIRYEKIDLLKGIAIILVVMGHAMSDITYMTFPFNVIYSFHMPLLFFLSGYLLELTQFKYMQMGIFKFIRRKTVSLLLPYTIWTVLVPWLFSIFDMEVLRNSLVSVTGINGGGMWFLPVLFGLNLMYAFIWFLRERIFKQKDGFIKDVMLVFAAVILLLVLIVITKYPYLTNMLSYAIPFFFGVFTNKYSFIEKIVKTKWICVLAIGLYIVLFPTFDFYNTSMMTQVKRIVLSVFIIIVLWNLCAKETYQNIVLKFIIVCGKYSLAIYLIHGYLSKWKLILERFDSVILGTGITVLGSVLMCAVCILCAKILEKNKITGKLFLGK